MKMKTSAEERGEREREEEGKTRRWSKGRTWQSDKKGKEQGEFREMTGGGGRQERGRSNYRRDRQGECFNRAAARRFRPTRTSAAVVAAAAAPHSEYQ